MKQKSQRSDRIQKDEPGSNLHRRHRVSKVWKSLFSLTVTLSVILLAILIFTVINKSFGYTAVQYTIDPTTLTVKPLSELNNSELITILQNNLSRSRIRTLEVEKPLVNRSQADLLNLVNKDVVEPRIIESWTLVQSLIQYKDITDTMNENFQEAHLEFRSWINWGFLSQPMSSNPAQAGIRTALLGSLYIITISILIAFPLGIGSAIYLEEYSDKKRWYNRIIQTNIENLAGVPSIIYGILGLAIFVRALGPITSGQIFGIDSASGRTVLSAGLTMGLLVLPIIIMNAQEAIRSVPVTLRQASYGLGATRWQTVWYHVLPEALPGILTGTILSVSRALGETAPLIVVGASTLIFKNPTSPFSSFTALPIQIYNWTARPQDQFRNLAAAAILVLIVTLLSLNSIAIILRNRYAKRKRAS